VHVHTHDKKIEMLFKILCIYDSIDTDFYSRLQKGKLRSKHVMLLLERETAVLQCVCCPSQSHVYEFSTCKDVRANARTLPQSFG